PPPITGPKCPTPLQLSRENNLYYRLQIGFTAKEIKAAAPGSADGIPHPDICYPSVGLFIARDDRLLLAVKAGDNGDSHNHNDVGSFTVYKDGLPLLIDVGVESYTQKTFSPRRYEIWTMQSAYHNLPTVNGIMQKDGEACRAKEVRYQISDALCEIDMDIAGAYPAESGLQYYRRKASLIKGKEILIKDSFSFQDGAACLCADNDLRKNSVVLSFMTYEKPVLRNAAPDSPKALVFSVGSLGTLAVTGGEKAEIETIPITDARLKTAWEHEIYRILITAVNSEMEIKIF
ncbi:MAG: heparinase II/III-family protein, partial [Lachnospiraceae bacterium]|nr:heparinase II/III-family protein [Lachnospiraceae bacterium]